MTLERGTLLHKRYRIVEILGQGGMGSVYRAVDENLGVDVAVKENLFTTDEYARQFRLEAVILANLRHPNLPRVTDHFVIGDQGQYLVMDYIEGEDLRQRMERQGNILEDEAILLGASICDALTYLHTRKPPILHRDIKPGNVKITPDGHVFLVDFGLAKVLHGSQATTTGARAMTPGYSPPEQYGTARTDPRTDIYSLGATLYASLTGIIPEDGLARAMDNTQLTPLRKRNSKISRRLAAAIEKAMGIDPADRFQTAEEFKRALLGSKSKTQRLPGEYVIQPAPVESGSSEIQKPAQKDSASLSPLSQEPVSEELPVFKPPKRRKKFRLLPAFLLILFLLAASLVGLARFAPHLLPPVVMDALPPQVVFFLGVPASTPAAPPTSMPASPTPMEAALTVTSALSPTPTLTPEPTLTPTLTPTPTLPPVIEITATPENTPVLLPTPTGGGTGQIAFASARTGIPQIYLVNLDQTGLTPLTNMQEGACQPSWSPDGSQLVFISPCLARGDISQNVYNNSSLYIMNADGSGQKPLTSVPGSDFDPAWSPDGKRIAFTSLRNGYKDIYVLTLETGAIIQLTDVGSNVQENSQPAWSPFGNQIAYTVKRFNAYQVWVMSDTGEGKVQIARSGQRLWDYLPLWSPDGEMILFSQREVGVATSRPWLMSIRYADRDTKDPVRLELPRPIEDVEFSPDGQWIVCESSDNQGNRDIYFMTITGANRTRLTEDPALDFDPAWRPAP
ncbi:MAG: serine/threonine-protein kinase [Chloroflexi bacterium]|nr:serine/threonine-protein kinase [Chloroflexota bacterium]